MKNFIKTVIKQKELTMEEYIANKIDKLLNQLFKKVILPEIRSSNKKGRIIVHFKISILYVYVCYMNHCNIWIRGDYNCLNKNYNITKKVFCKSKYHDFFELSTIDGDCCITIRR